MGVGSRFPAHATSAGKVLLGALPQDEIRKLYEGPVALPAVTPFTITDLSVLLQQIEKARLDGWCYINQETAMGIASIAVAIRRPGRTPLFAQRQRAIELRRPDHRGALPSCLARHRKCRL